MSCDLISDLQRQFCVISCLFFNKQPKPEHGVLCCSCPRQMASSRLASLLTHLPYYHAWKLDVCYPLSVFIRHPERVSGARHPRTPQREHSVYDPHRSACHLWVKAPIYHFICKKYCCEMPRALPNDLFFPPANAESFQFITGSEVHLTSARSWSPTSFSAFFSSLWKK